MSTFGSPGGQQKLYQPKPPERGSFPLDHDGECKHLMMDYLQCIKRSRGYNEQECRLLSKSYLECRMDRGLMARDTPANLGYAEAQLAQQGLGRDNSYSADGKGAGKIVDGAIGPAVQSNSAKQSDANKTSWWR